jgi:hypothetical protein
VPAGDISSAVIVSVMTVIVMRLLFNVKRWDLAIDTGLLLDTLDRGVFGPVPGSIQEVCGNG